MLADAAIILVSLAVAIALRLVIVVLFELKAGDDPVYHLQRALGNFAWSAIPLVTICLLAFWQSGFYTYGRSYVSRYRPLVVLQAVSIAFLIFGFLQYFVSNGDLVIPRSALIAAWVMASCLLIGARAWNSMWHRVVVPERETAMSESKKTESVLVIGGAGYIGSALVPLLLEKGHRVRLLDVLLFGEGPIEGVIHHPQLELVRGDFRNVESVLQAMDGIDAVVHLGAIVGDPACKLDESLTIDVNLVSTQMIALIAKSRKVPRFIFASTCSVYGASDSLLDESSETRPLSLYGKTKLASEQVVLELASDRFNPTVFRFATIYGLSGRTRFDLVVNLMAARARLDGEISVHGGNQWRPFVHVEDAARAIVAAIDAKPSLVAGEVFNVGSDAQNYTITQIAELVHQRVVDAKVHIDEGQEDRRNYRVSFAKIVKRLGFKPKWTVEEGIQQVLEAIARGEISHYDDPRYSNAKYLTSEGTGKLNRDQWARDLLEKMPQ
jgi:nucleoside-diphosphate-sugar epimerase